MVTFVLEYKVTILALIGKRFCLLASKSQFYVFFYYSINGYICDPKRLNP
jgi:hypothetical protein